MRRIVLLLAVAASFTAAADERIRAWRMQNEARILTELRDLLAIPNVASDTPNIERNAAALAEMLRRRGVEPRLLRVEDAPPVVFGELRAAGAKETLVLYAHYDGQPVDRAKWAGDPWTPTWLNLGCFWVWQISLAWLLAIKLEWGAAGVYWAMTIAFSTFAVIGTLAFRRGTWKGRTV